jgi:hypothetical protein
VSEYPKTQPADCKQCDPEAWIAKHVSTPILG